MYVYYIYIYILYSLEVPKSRGFARPTFLNSMYNFGVSVQKQIKNPVKMFTCWDSMENETGNLQSSKKGNQLWIGSWIGSVVHSLSPATSMASSICLIFT